MKTCPQCDETNVDHAAECIFCDSRFDVDADTVGITPVVMAPKVMAPKNVPALVQESTFGSHTPRAAAEPKGLALLFDWQFRGEPQDAVRALGIICGGVGILILSYVVYLIMAWFQRISGKGVFFVVVGPLAGGVICLVGAVRLLKTTIRHGMHVWTLLSLTVLAGSFIGPYLWWQSKLEDRTQMTAQERDKELENQRVKEEKERHAAEAQLRKEEQSSREAELVKACVEIPNLLHPQPSDPYLKGKLVILGDHAVDYAGRAPPPPLFAPVGYRPPTNSRPPDMKMSSASSALEALDHALPATLRAEKLDDVQTVVWVKWVDRVVGEYENPVSQHDYAYRCYATVTVIDRTIPAVVGTKEFEGPAPPESVENNKIGRGIKPTAAIVKYLLELPRK